MATEVYKLDNYDYQRFREFIAERTGLHFPDKKRADLERGVFEALSFSPYETVDDYFQALAGSANDREIDYLISLLTVGETYFYRDEGQFRLLQNDILPRLISERMVTTRRLRIWSAGCATGEEPYSIAVILRELIPYIDTWDTLILAGDINRRSLEKAKAARYNKWSFRTMPEEWLDKYFFVSSANEFHLSDIIKKSVKFEYLNLKEKTFPSFLSNTQNMDLIVCRNVTIYFDQETISQLMDRFYDCLNDGGWLLMGASDPIPPSDKFWPRNHSGVFIYQKKSSGFEVRHPERPRAAVKNAVISPPASMKEKKQKPKPPPLSDSLAESLALLEVGQPVLAADKLAAKLKEEPDSIEAALLMAKVEVARGRLQQAKKWAEKVVGKDKLSIQAYYLLSAIYQGLSQEEQAIEFLKKTVYLDKNFVAGHFSIACLYRKQGRPAAAEKAFKNVIRLMVGRPEDEIVPETNGITCGKLLELANKNAKARE